MTKGPFLLLIGLLAADHVPAAAEEVTRRAGRLTLAVDEASAYPGGLIPVRLRSRTRGQPLAVFGGRRFPFLNTRRGLRALVPVPIDMRAGQATLGIEIRLARARQRFALQVQVAPRSYEPRAVVLPELKKAMLSTPEGSRDGRLVQLFLRTVTPRQQWQGAFQPPVAAPAEPTFGALQTYGADRPVEPLTDAVWGEYHRGLDYAVAPGTAVSAPAAAHVLFAGPLVLTGETVILDHGHGVVSVLYHLQSSSVRAGDAVAAGTTVGESGESGIAADPHLHWGVYVNAIPVDPRVMETLAD